MLHIILNTIFWIFIAITWFMNWRTSKRIKQIEKSREKILTSGPDSVDAMAYMVHGYKNMELENDLYSKTKCRTYSKGDK